MKRALTPYVLTLCLALATSASAQHHMAMDKDYDDGPGGGDPDAPAACEGAPNKVQITSTATAFSPSTITIHAGQAVCWTWNTGGTSHNVRADDGSWTSGAPAGSGTYQYTFPAAGTFGYHCQVHGSPTGGMRGTVTVLPSDDGGGDGGGGSGPGTLADDPSAYTVDEAAGSVSLSVTRTGGDDGKVTVKAATGTGSASKGKDFLPRTVVLTWNAGDHSPKTLSVTIKNDSSIETDETFPVALSKPTGGATLGTTSATVTIHDDDNPGCSSSTSAPSSVKAVGAAGAVRLSWLDGPSAVAVHVDRSLVGGGFTEVGTVGAGVGEFLDLGLPAGTTFLYRLRTEGVDAGSGEPVVVAAATDGAAGGCDARALCLGDGRFEAKAASREDEGAPVSSARARIVSGSAPRSGLFELAAGEGADLLLSVVDGCAVNGHQWVHLAAVTEDAELVVTVRDTRTGRTWAYYNPAGKAAGPVRDADAFACR
jgi:plastocyanin